MIKLPLPPVTDFVTPATPGYHLLPRYVEVHSIERNMR